MTDDPWFILPNHYPFRKLHGARNPLLPDTNTKTDTQPRKGPRLLPSNGFGPPHLSFGCETGEPRGWFEEGHPKEPTALGWTDLYCGWTKSILHHLAKTLVSGDSLVNTNNRHGSIHSIGPRGRSSSDTAASMESPESC